MGTIFFFLTIFVVPGFPAGALTGRWGLLAVVTGGLMLRMELPGYAWAFLAYLALMAWRTPVGYEGLNAFIHCVFIVILYCYAVRLPNLKRVAIGMGLGIALNSAAVIGQQFFDLNWFPQITLDSGLYFNRNTATETAAMTLALVVGYRLWWLVPGIVPTLVFGSRMPMIALGVAGAVAAWRKSAWLAVAVLIIPVLIADFWLQAHGTTIYAGSFDTLQQRFGTWYDGAHGFTILGQGLGSWLVNFPLYQVHTSALELRWEQAHNDVVQIVFEFGAVGAIFIGIFLYRLAVAEQTPEFFALVVFVVIGLAGFPTWQPVTGALAVVCAGWLFSRGDSLRDLLVRFRLSIRRWYANPRSELLRNGGKTVSADAGPTFGPGLSCYRETRVKRSEQDREGVTV